MIFMVRSPTSIFCVGTGVVRMSHHVFFTFGNNPIHKIFPGDDHTLFSPIRRTSTTTYFRIPTSLLFPLRRPFCVKSVTPVVFASVPLLRDPPLCRGGYRVVLPVRHCCCLTSLHSYSPPLREVRCDTLFNFPDL